MIGRSIVPPARDHTHVQTVEMKQKSARPGLPHGAFPCRHAHALLARHQAAEHAMWRPQRVPCALANVRADNHAQTRRPPPTAWPIQPPCAVSKRRAPAPEARVPPECRSLPCREPGSQERAKTPYAARRPRSPAHNQRHNTELASLTRSLGIIDKVLVVSARPRFRNCNKTPRYTSVLSTSLSRTTAEAPRAATNKRQPRQPFAALQRTTTHCW